MSVITLMTDFGLDDEYVGVIKGVILSISPGTQIVDITHHITPQDIVQAAYTLESYRRYFPPKTVHVAVVDPGVGSMRSIVALAADEQLFLAPDNGVLGLVVEAFPNAEVYRVENEAYFLKPISRTFHGRDIFAPVAAHLAKGLDGSKLGPAVNPKDLQSLGLWKPELSAGGELRGKIIAVDRFGNLISNIDERMLAMLREQNPKKALEVRLNRDRISGVCGHYAAVGRNRPLALINSRGLLEIAVNCGHAAGVYKAGTGDTVHVVLTARNRGNTTERS